MERNTNQDVFVMALAGNKIDAVTENGKPKAVSTEVSKAVAKQHNMIHEEVSAKTGKGITELFGELAQRIADV
jgi:Ras-related protein Rab-5C